MHSLVVLPLAAPLLAAHELDQPQPGTRFGHAVLALSDLDGDGVREFAVGAPMATSRGSRGLVVVLSGADRSVLQSWRGDDEHGGFGWVLSDAGDVDGDGTGDVLVGYWPWNRTEIRSGRDGTMLAGLARDWRETLPIGDFDEDGCADLLLTDEENWKVRRGNDSSILASWRVDIGGGQAYSVGDGDGDGIAEVLVSGARPRLVRVQRTESADVDVTPLSHSIRAARPVGDLDGDGVEDFVARGRVDGDPFFNVYSGTEPRTAICIVVVSCLGAHGSGECFGHAVAATGDLDGDGRRDLVVAKAVQPFEFGVEARSSRDGKRVWERIWSDHGATAGVSLAPFDDRDGDGVRDVLMGSCAWHVSGPLVENGLVKLVSGKGGEVIWTITERELDEWRE